MPEKKTTKESEQNERVRRVPKIVPPQYNQAANETPSLEEKTVDEAQNQTNQASQNFPLRVRQPELEKGESLQTGEDWEAAKVELQRKAQGEFKAFTGKNHAKAANATAERGIKREKINLRLSEKKLLRLLKRRSLDLYSLEQVLRGSSLPLYCVLYNASKLSDGRCQITQLDLMLRAEINNPGTLARQERWLQQLRLIEKENQLGDHKGAEYRVYPLDSLPLPQALIEELPNYLLEYDED
jgi:hypothetical protein